MQEQMEHVAPPQKEKIEVVSKEPEVQPAVIELREYRQKFLRVEAHRLAEKSTVHCADEQKLFGEAGDFYIRLDGVQEFILPDPIFRKLFMLKTEK